MGGATEPTHANQTNWDFYCSPPPNTLGKEFLTDSIDFLVDFFFKLFFEYH